MPDLNCYKLRGPSGGALNDFDEAFDEADLERLETRGPVQIGRVRAKLYFAPSRPHPPSWAGALDAMFGEDIPFPQMSGAAALLVVRCTRGDDVVHLAFTFGYGWQLMRPAAFERGFGLRTSLNIVFEGDSGSGDLDAARLRSVDAKRVGVNLLRSRHQVAGVAVLEELDVDIRRDLLSGVTGIPMDPQAWGPRVTGRDSLQFSRRSLDDLSGLCDQILDAYEATFYKARFSFVDDFVAVTDPITKAFLQEEVMASIHAASAPDLDLAPPELIEWERVAGFQYHTERGRNPTTRVELRLPDYIASLRNKSMLDDITADKLRSHYVWAIDGNGADVKKWSVWSCLFGQIDLADDTYVMENGDFYLVSTDFLSSLDADVRSLTECTKKLPNWHPLDHEDVYNLKAANSSQHFLLLDQKTVRIGSHTNQVEICDILTDDGYLIHVKKKRDGSASLSHLFAQGANSAELIIASPEFLELAKEKIASQEILRAAETGDRSFEGQFDVFSAPRIAARDYEVVFAIFAKWQTGGFETLPFFSKMTLRNAVDDIKRLGLQVSVKKIEGA